MSLSVLNNFELCYRGTSFKVQGGSVIAAFFLAHNYVSEQFGNYVEYGTYKQNTHGILLQNISTGFELFWDDFPTNKQIPSETWTHPPMSIVNSDFENFSFFAKPLTVMQDFFMGAILCIVILFCSTYILCETLRNTFWMSVCCAQNYNCSIFLGT